MAKGIDRERTVGAAQEGPFGPQIRKARIPDQRAVAEDPGIGRRHLVSISPHPAGSERAVRLQPARVTGSHAKARRAPMKRIIALAIVVVLVIGAWTGAWFWGAGFITEQVKALASEDGATDP